MKKALISFLVIFIVAVMVYIFRENIVRQFFRPKPVPLGVEQVTNFDLKGEEGVSVVVSDLKIPWELEFLPEGGMLITERIGNLVFINSDGERYNIKIDDVFHREFGEGGALGHDSSSRL